MEAEISLNLSQEPSTGPYPEPAKSSLASPVSPLISSIHLCFFFLVIPFHQAFPQVIYMLSSSPHSCYIPRLAHSYSWKRAEVMKHIIMQFHQFSETSSLLFLNILVSNLFSNILSLYSPFNIRDVLPYP